jgi:hypothetical protein
MFDFIAVHPVNQSLKNFVAHSTLLSPILLQPEAVTGLRQMLQRWIIFWGFQIRSGFVPGTECGSGFAHSFTVAEFSDSK